MQRAAGDMTGYIPLNAAFQCRPLPGRAYSAKNHSFPKGTQALSIAHPLIRINRYAERKEGMQ